VQLENLAQMGELDQAVDRALAQLASHQLDDGAFPGDYGGPMFLLPMYMGTCYGTGVSIPSDVKADMVRYLRHVQNADGGFGLHVESHSYLFTSTIIYAVLRLYDVPSTDPMLVRLRSFVRAQGGPLRAAAWGKFFLTLLNLYDYRGLNPVPPELWILPEALAFHPSRMWCHTRMVYLPMSYLYGRRVQQPSNARVLEIRAELYGVPYEQVDWNAGRQQVADSDCYTPVGGVMRGINELLLRYEQRPVAALRERALRRVLDLIEAEDRNTAYICLGPVSKLYHLWVWHHHRPSGPEFEKHVAQLPEYLWRGKDGTKMQGYHSSQLWDTAFAARAVLAAQPCSPPASALASALLERAHKFVVSNQVREDLPDRQDAYRDRTRGGFCFSAKDNGWTVSDCTAEGLRVALELEAVVAEPLSEARMIDAVDLLLRSQMKDGGFASYEPARAPAWLERLNPSDCFGDIMIDYPYVECTAACMGALSRFRSTHPGVRDHEIDAALFSGTRFLLGQQRADGSFEGSWGVCFTYGTMFGIEGLRAGGLTERDRAVQRAATFLKEKQLPDGGWGETPESNLQRRYVHAECGQAVMTSWAMLGLIAAGQAASAAVRRGAQRLVRTQRADGTWPDEHIAGMFNKTCAIHYDNYLKVFPLWALAEARAHGVSS
jgi:squalene/oxidosqualene cyclase-like protein